MHQIPRSESTGRVNGSPGPYRTDGTGANRPVRADGLQNAADRESVADIGSLQVREGDFLYSCQMVQQFLLSLSCSAEFSIAYAAT